MTTTSADLWHGVHRAARDHRKRLVALYGVTLTAPALVLGALAHRLVVGEGAGLGGLRRPLDYAFGALRDAWMADKDLSVLVWLLAQGVLLSVLWGYFGGALARMAAVDLTAGRREAPGPALAFARRHLGALVGSKVAVCLSVLAPLGLAVLLASVARLDGVLGAVLGPAGVVAASALVLAAVVSLSLSAAGGFLSAPTIACEDSDAFDALSRVYGYATASLSRVLAVRLRFLGGFALGTLWTAVRTGAAVVLGALAIEAGVGSDRFGRMLAALREAGTGARTPPAAEVVPAAALALVAAGVLAYALADVVVRAACARVGAYLAVREAIDRVPPHRLQSAAAAPAPLEAEEAGFVEVSRIGVPTRRPEREDA